MTSTRLEKRDIDHECYTENCVFEEVKETFANGEKAVSVVISCAVLAVEPSRHSQVLSMY